MFRSKVQEMILRRRSRSMNGAAQHAGSSPTASCDAGGGGKGAARAPSFAAPRLLHSSSLPAGGRAAVVIGSPARDPEALSAYAMSPTSVLDASAAFGSPGPAVDAGGGKRRPWCDGCAGPHGLADVLDCAHEAQRRKNVLRGAVRAQAPALVRSSSLDRRVEFGVKNKSSWLPLRSARAGAAAEEDDGPASEDYTCVISRGPNPRTVHIFGDRVVEGDGVAESPPPAPVPARQGRGFLSL
ncbi:hypothetical protein CFC21_073496 [Triticum aestivum]|uniref:Uncharacterized protein n=3 Tax=Triticum TaxID=4564 RepID=A0A9R1AQP0_TRITD|nr:FCS-Like Zinc finger 8-like [Triticum dicoccoides]XP_044390428.1 FCS-Like Zinc finger 8-like [Triticum aestivum]KAF7067633.1 hypothetical protein CFC21_073496 [Triticum aestivum]VAI36605.1 unnamed protein product [Triticum turgidum subsp. durum]